MSNANKHTFGVTGKRSQTELLGFAIVVLLIAVGMLFVIGFIVNEKPTDNRAAYLYKETATNLNDALSETTTTCRNLKVKELFVQCVDNDRLMCPQVDSTAFADSVGACDYLHQFISKRLDETIGSSGLKYDYNYSYRYDAPKEYSVWSSIYSFAHANSARPFFGCNSQRSVLAFSASTHQIIIYLDIFSDCPK